MDRRLGILLGAGFGIASGAVAMYLLDPDRGRARRAYGRGRVTAALHRVDDGMGRLEGMAQDIANEFRGSWQEARSRITETAVPDPVLEARVRSAIGRACRHPHSIRVIADDGHVTLLGSILASEVPRLLGTVRFVRGVRNLEDRLEVHEKAENIPSLQ